MKYVAFNNEGTKMNIASKANLIFMRLLIKNYNFVLC